MEKRKTGGIESRAGGKETKHFADVAVDGRVFEAGAGGMAAYTLNVMRRLPQVKFWVIHQKRIEIENEIENKSLVKVKIPLAGKWMTDQVIIPKVLKRLGNPIYWQSANMGVPVFTKSRVLLTVHDVIPALWNEYFAQSRFPLAAKWLYLARMQIGLWKADKVMVDSPMTRSDLVRRFWVDRKKIEIVPLGVGVEKRDRGREKVTLEKYGLRPKDYVLNHGGMDRRKNLDRLVQGFSLIQKLKFKNQNLNSKLKSLKLVIAGDGVGVRKRIETEIERLKIEDRIIFTGRVAYDEMQVLVRHAKLIVYPTLAEGFGLPLLEAMAAGVSAVASDIPVLRWIGRRVPYYVDPESVESIVEGILEALKNGDRDRDLRIKEGKKRAGEFSWERTAGEVYEEIKRLGVV